MEKKIMWKAPEGDVEHEIPVGVTVKFVREDGKKVEVKFGDQDGEDCVLVSVDGGEVAFSHSYFATEVPRVPIEERLKLAFENKNFQHRISPALKEESSGVDADVVGEGENCIGRIVTEISHDKLGGDIQPVFSPLFAVDPENGNVLSFDDERLRQDGYRPEVKKCLSEKLWVEDSGRTALKPTEPEFEELVEKVMKRLTKLGWKYFLMMEERGDGEKVYVYARGC